jgi:hypothetical protein
LPLHVHGVAAHATRLPGSPVHPVLTARARGGRSLKRSRLGILSEQFARGLDDAHNRVAKTA